MREQREKVGTVLEHEAVDVSELMSQVQQLTEEEATAQADFYLNSVELVEYQASVSIGDQELIHLGATHVSLSSPEKLEQDKLKGKVTEYMTYDRIYTYAGTYKRSHKLENLVAQELASYGVQAVALPAKADGDTTSKQADIIITLANGRKCALEVKEARYQGCTLGLPKANDSHTEGYKSYPRSLWVDSCEAWDAKVAACESRGETLLGCIVLCPIGRLSNEERTVYGLVYLPACISDEWAEEETCNRNRLYWAYKAYRDSFGTLGDLLADLSELEQEEQASE
ncbi:hypothetical protein WDZ92_04560 [Nostoc sp. NIES-2111]